MASSMLTEPIVARSGSSVHSREEDEFNNVNEENPLEIRSNSSAQATPSYVVRDHPMEFISSHNDQHDLDDEPPPPYEERIYQEPVQDGPQTMPVELSHENGPQLHIAPVSEFPEVVRPHSSNSRSMSDGTLHPSPLQLRQSSSFEGESPREHFARRTRTYSSAKAREAGFEIPRKPVSPRSNSTSSIPSITVLSPTEPLQHLREPGKLIAYLIPYPKPRLEGVKLEDIPDRFLVYTPTPPPLSKPALGEKETQWHKNRRQWQEDVRKVMMSNAVKGPFKGLKAKTTILIGKGVDATKSTQLEFLDRAIEEADEPATDAPTSPSTAQSPSELAGVQPEPPQSPLRTGSTTSLEKPKKPKNVEELTLIYPSTFPLAPEQIRTEFVDLLNRTREKSRRDAIISSSLFPVAAALDASLLFTFGGLTEVSGVWAYTSIRGTMASKKMVKDLNRGENQTDDKVDEESHIEGCMCGLHEDTFGSQREAPVKNKGKSKAKKTGINLRMQQSPKIDILRRYLDLACLKKDFNMFPQLDQKAGDVNEAAVLDAIGWRPLRRSGRDLVMELGDKKFETLTPEQDEQWQTMAEREDVKRFMKKGAKEWVEFCKAFQKEQLSACNKK